MATFTKFNSFVEAAGRKVHNLNADTLKVVLTNSAPSASNTQLSDITQISNGNGYTTGGSTAASNAYSQTSGTAKLTATDVVFTASGSMGPFRYAVLYNDTATNDELIGYWDYGSSITLASGDTFTVDFDGTNGILQLA
jgi:hypothetical protein